MRIKQSWLEAEKRSFLGWDFTELEKGSSSDPLPWSYKEIVETLTLGRVLDMGTGGGEILLSLPIVPGETVATEMYLPNYEYAKARLQEAGVELVFVTAAQELPFDDQSFDTVLNRHETYDPKEVYRILKKGGNFMTQQVGGQNTRAFATWLLGKSPLVTSEDWDMAYAIEQLEAVGFEIIASEECVQPLKFYDMETFIYFAKIIEWEFPDFSVHKQYDKLHELEKQLVEKGYFEMLEHRFYIQCQRS